MKPNTSTKIFEKLQLLERNLQRLKIETYLNLPMKKEEMIYPEKKLLRTLRKIRKSIWQERYAKKI
jgi:hypothetical protein